MAESTIKIEGMSCGHCTAAVKKALDGLDGVEAADVETGSASVRFDDTKVKQADLEGAIVSAGYKVVAG